MDKPDWHYRTEKVVATTILGLDSHLSTIEKYYINYFVLKSERYREVVDSGGSVHFDEIKGLLQGSRLSVGEVFRFLIKVLVHRIFYAVFKLTETFAKVASSRPTIDTYAKAYVKVEHQLLEREILDVEEISSANTLFLIFPFPLKVSRQMAYIWSMLKSAKHFSLIGLPYSLSDTFAVLIYQSAFSISRADVKANERLCRSLRKPTIKRLLVADDCEASCILFHANMREEHNGLAISLVTHGIGTYSPFISADNLYVYTRHQNRFYGKYNSQSSFKTCFIEDELPTDEFRTSSRSQPLAGIIWFSQVTAATKFLNEEEYSAVADLRDLCMRYDLDMVYKPHPNYEGPIQWGDLHTSSKVDERYFFGVSFYSTSYLSSRCQKNFLFSTELFDASELFNPDVCMVSIEQIELEVRNTIGTFLKKE